MTQQEIIEIRNFALRLLHDEDTAQEILFEVIRQNLTFPLALNYVKLVAKGSANRLNAKSTGKKKIDALNNKTISIHTTPSNAEDCTLEDVLINPNPAPDQNFEIEEFKSTLNAVELQILNLVLDGFTVREICRKLKISSKTYSKILNKIRKKALDYF